MKLIRYILPLILLAVQWGCVDDDYIDDIKVKGSSVELTLTVKVPGIAVPATYGMEVSDESKLQTIDILVFKDNGTGSDNETLLYITHATDIDNSGSSSKNFKALLQKSEGTDKHRIVLLANLRNEVDKIKGSLTTLMKKQEVLDLIQFSNTQAWNTSGTNITCLPMWGETNATHKITSSTTPGILGNITLLRSVACINVGLNLDPYGYPLGFGSIFFMSDVKLYNANNKGSAAPHKGNYNGIKVSSPSIPASAALNTRPIGYHHDTPDYEFVREIYTAECDNINLADSDKPFCLLIGGYYTKPDDPLNTTNKSWYRIDFYDRTSSSPAENRINILRNYRYQVNITNVNGKGFQTEEEAYNSNTTGMESSITAWEEYNLNNITFDGQYQLALTTDELYFYKDGKAQELNIYADHPNGWHIDMTNKPSWLQISPENGISEEPATITVSADTYTSMADRSGEFIIRTGKLEKKIKVTQTFRPKASITVSPSDMTFSKNTAACLVNITTEPENTPVYFEKVREDIVWRSGGFPESGLALSSYLFHPEANNTGNVLTSLVKAYILDEDNNKVSQEITFKQRAEDIGFKVINLRNPYPARSVMAQLGVNSEIPWKVVAVSDHTMIDPNGLVNAIQPAGYQECSFLLLNNPNFKERKGTLTVSADYPGFTEQNIEIVQEHLDPVFYIKESIVDMGTIWGGAARQFSASITTNSEWKYTVSGNSNFVKVLDYYPNVVSGQKSPHSASNTAFYFEPSKDYSLVPGNYSATFSFTTVNTDDMAPILQDITVKRTVPPVIENGDFPYKSQTIVDRAIEMNVTASSNVPWRAVGMGVNEAVGTGSLAQPGVNKVSKITLPKRPSRTILVVDIFAVADGVRYKIGEVTQMTY